MTEPLQSIFTVCLIVVISYLLGSIPSAYLVARARNVDIFAIGSGNMGATNVLRGVGLAWALLVWFLDSVKGMIAIAIAWQLMPENKAAASTIAAVVSIVGHNWSLFATLITGSLRGGKGAATAFGTLLMVAPAPTIIIGFLLSGLIILVTRYMSLGVLFMFALSLSWITILTLQNAMPAEFILYTLLTAAMIALRFRENIQRLLSGTERRIGDPA